MGRLRVDSAALENAALELLKAGEAVGGRRVVGVAGVGGLRFPSVLAGVVDLAQVDARAHGESLGQLGRDVRLALVEAQESEATIAFGFRNPGQGLR